MHTYNLGTALGDIAAGLAIVGSWAGYLPDVAAGMAIIYYLIHFFVWMRK